MNETVSSLGTLGFWLFMAVLVVAIAWAYVRKTKIRHETLTKIIDSGQNLDREIIETIFPPKEKPQKKPDDPFKGSAEGGGFFFFIGLAIVFFALVGEPISYPLLGLGIFTTTWGHWVWYSSTKELKKQYKKKNLEGLE